MIRACWAIAFLAILILQAPLHADERLHRVTFVGEDQQTRTIEAKLLVEAQDGGKMFVARDGRIWSVTPQQLQGHEVRDEPFEPLSAEELGRQVQEELGDGFEVVTTQHYVICTNAGRRYAQWCGALFERLYRSFHTHWRNSALELHDPQFPLLAVVFNNRQRFAEYAVRELRDAAADSRGYFSIRENRMVLFDLTASPNSPPPKTTAEITRKVAASPLNAATVVHEATHQIAFNIGVHTRYADNPLWMLEGLAMYFETPDLNSRSGWRTVGKINPARYRQFQDYVQHRRQPDSLITLLTNDDRFRQTDDKPDAYAEAWAFTYFLIKTRRQQYAEYLARISQKPRLVWDDPQQRLADFQAVFGDDLEDLDRQFLRYLQRAAR